MEFNKKDYMVSIIMYIEKGQNSYLRAIKSIINQTYQNWELIIISDCISTSDFIDDLSVLSKVRVYYLDKNLKNGYLPLKNGFLYSEGKYILNLDTDSFIENSYIEKMMMRIIEEDADICCGQVENLNPDIDNDISKDKFDYGTILNGKEAYLNTVPESKIDLHGYLASRDLWDNLFNKGYLSDELWLKSNDVFNKSVLLEAKRVVFCEAKCYNASRGMIDNGIFEIDDSITILQNYIESYFGKSSKEYTATAIYNYLTQKKNLEKLIEKFSGLKNKQIREYISKLKIWHDEIDWGIVSDHLTHESGLDRNFNMQMLVAMVTNKNIKALIKYSELFIKSKIRSIYYNKYYYWYILRKKREIKTQNAIESSYEKKAKTERNAPHYVLNIYDGSVHSGGLADRFRGIISTYYICKQKGYEYKLYYDDPFPLSEYLEPNKYNWQVNENEISYNINKIKIISLSTTQDSEYQYKKQEKYLNKNVDLIKEQNHIYSNAGFAYEINYSELFHELFKPSDKLQCAINKQIHEIGGNYISVSCRFLDLLGDFNETYGYNERLSESEAEKLLCKLLVQIELLHKKFPDNVILVNSDSITFLERVKELKYVYVIPGEVTHIDNSDERFSYEKYEKTFLDFFAIANAEQIYLLKSGRMYASGFPFAASKIYNKPFYKIDC